MDLDEELELGPDGDLVSEMISKAVVPLLTKAFEAGAYDPYSATQTRRAVDLVDVVQHLTGKDSRKFQVSQGRGAVAMNALTGRSVGILESCPWSVSHTIVWPRLHDVYY